MLIMGINDMETHAVELEDGELVVSEITIGARELDPCFDQESGQYYECAGFKELYVAAIINNAEGTTGYSVSDYSFFSDDDDGEYTIYEAYYSAAEYRNSDYEPFITMASDCAEAFYRTHYSLTGTLHGTDGEHGCEDCGACDGANVGDPD